MAATSHGLIDWEMQQDEDGHREYTGVFRVEAAATDGPLTIRDASGLPAIGSSWQFGSDSDQWAWRKLTAGIRPVASKEANKFWDVTLNWTTKPYKDCKESAFENPLLEPQKISGGVSTTTEEALTDRFDDYITTSAFEQFRGPQIEFDIAVPTVSIEQNVAFLDLATVTSMVNTVNLFPLWGMDVRCVKLGNWSWELKFYGTCAYYYTRKFEFQLNFATFDRTLLDEGTKVLSGKWDRDTGGWSDVPIEGSTDDPNPNRFNRGHMIRFKDRNDENTKVILDGAARPYVPVDAAVIRWWCLNDNVAPICFNGTCAAAFAQAVVMGVNTRVSGPYLSEADCTGRCSRSHAEPQAPVCGTPAPGRILVQYYRESNFLMLGIPATL